MSGLIILRDQKKAWLGGVEQTGLWQNGAKTWARPATSDPMAQYYGTGAGQVPIRTKASSAVMSGANVQRIPNVAGAGSTFDLIAGSSNITLSGGALDLSPAQYLRFGTNASTPPNLMDTTVFIVANIRTTTVDQYFLGQGSPQTDVYLKAGGAQMVFRRRSEVTNNFEDVTVNLAPAVIAGLRLYEISISTGGQISITINGELRGTATHPNWPALNAWNFASGRNPVNANGLNALVHDVSSLVRGGAHDANRAAIRGILNDLYSLGIPTDSQSLIRLTDIANNNLFTVQERTATTLIASRASGSRSHFTFNQFIPAGSRIRFTTSGTGSLWVRLASEATLSNDVIDVLIAATGTQNVDFVVPSSRPWFGFLVASSTENSTINISNFRVDAP